MSINALVDRLTDWLPYNTGRAVELICLRNTYGRASDNLARAAVHLYREISRVKAGKPTGLFSYLPIDVLTTLCEAEDNKGMRSAIHHAAVAHGWETWESRVEHLQMAVDLIATEQARLKKLRDYKAGSRQRQAVKSSPELGRALKTLIGQKKTSR